MVANDTTGQRVFFNMAANIAKNLCVLSCLKRVISLSLDKKSLILRSSRFCTEGKKSLTPSFSQCIIFFAPFK